MIRICRGRHGRYRHPPRRWLRAGYRWDPLGCNLKVHLFLNNVGNADNHRHAHFIRKILGPKIVYEPDKKKRRKVAASEIVRSATRVQNTHNCAIVEEKKK